MTPDETRLDGHILNLDRREEAASLCQSPGCVGSCSTKFRDKRGVRDVTKRGIACLPGTVPLTATWPAEEAPDGLMYGGLLWRESGLGREVEITPEGVPREMAEACRPVSE